MSLRAIEGGKRVVAEYDYHDPDGNLAYQVVRYEPKDFRQRRPDGKGGWSWSMEGQTRYLYHLPELVAGEDTFWVEGEKDADRLRGLGVQATTTCGGANAWDEAYLTQLPANGTLYIIPDNDAAGYQYATTIARAACLLKRRVAILNLPGVPPKGDVSDWLERGGSIAQLERLAEAAPQWTPDLQQTPRIERIGDDWTAAWDYFGVAVEFARYAESKHEVHAEVTISKRDQGVLEWVNLNLSSAISRRALAKGLTESAPAVPWQTVIERSCRAVVQTMRESAPSKRLQPSQAEQIAWLMPPFLPLGEIALMFGDGGSGKSLFAMAMCLSVCLGRDLTDGVTTEEQGAALYLDWESTEHDAAVRLRQLMLGLKLDPANDSLEIFHKAMTKPLHEDIAAIKREVDQHRIRVVVIDSLAPAAGNDPESGEAAIRIMRALRELHPASVIVIAHVSKEAADSKGMQRPYGSVFYQNLARNVWQVNRVEDAPINTLKMGFFHRKINLGAKSPNMEFRFTFDEDDAITLSQSALLDPELLSRTSVPNQILVALGTGAKNVNDLHDELSLSHAKVRAALKALVRDGKAVRLDLGGNRQAWALPTFRQPDDAQASL